MNAEDLNRIVTQIARQHKAVIRRNHSAVHVRRFLPSGIGPRYTTGCVIMAVKEPSAVECAVRLQPKCSKATATIIGHERVLPRRFH
jgi:hypothetical protein